MFKIPVDLGLDIVETFVFTQIRLENQHIIILYQLLFLRFVRTNAEVAQVFVQADAVPMAVQGN